MKYIIEIEDTPMKKGNDKVYRVKGFRTLVFDEYGLQKLKPLGNEITNAYYRGHDDGLEAGKGVLDEEKSDAYHAGFDSGYEAGREAMKHTVMNNLTRMLKGKPENQSFDSCHKCKHVKKSSEEYPCSECKHNHLDHFKFGGVFDDE